ncbi:hypothetical protein Q7P35_000760 [Cladosporium inversicolor]
MPVSTTMSLRQAIQASILFLVATTAAQSCYFPDGTLSPDTPCTTSSGHTSCCGSDALCMDDGLCFRRGILSRGSCTDKNWESDACAGYCRTESPGGGIAITACSDEGEDSKFTCGLNTKGCELEDTTWTLHGNVSLVLRPSQVAELTGSAVASTRPSSATTSEAAPSKISSHVEFTPTATKLYTSSDMAGLGCGLGLPLVFFLVVALCALFKERQNHTGPKLMYKLPDNHNEFGFHQQQQLQNYPQHQQQRQQHLHPNITRAHSNYSNSNFSVDSRITSHTMDVAKPAISHSFLDPYDSMKRDGKVSSEFQVHEMDGVSPHEPAVRHELSDKRFSTPTGN